MKKSNKPVEFNKKDFEFMNSLSSAILEQTPSKISKVLKLWLITIFLFIGWATFASIDEITRGDGKAIPYGQNQIIQNLEGGIVDAILIHEGQVVKAGDIILKINNAKSESTSRTNVMKYDELIAKQLRLNAEANILTFKTLQTDDPELKKQIILAKKLYDSNKLEVVAKDNSIVQQIEQKKTRVQRSTSENSFFRKIIRVCNRRNFYDSTNGERRC